MPRVLLAPALREMNLMVWAAEDESSGGWHGDAVAPDGK